MYIFSCIFTIICAIFLPITLAVIFCVKKQEKSKALLLGALTYIVFEVLIRLPTLSMVLPQKAWFVSFSTAQPVLYALFLGATAALFEEGGRFLVISLFLKKQRSALDGLALGVGHGGIEAMLIAGINAVALVLSSSQLASAGTVFAGGVERISMLAIQIALSVMVIKSIREKKYIWLLAAFLIHTAADFAAVLASSLTSFTWTVELVLFAAAIVIARFAAKEVGIEKPDPDRTKRL